jgi:hypothetical protein
VCVIARSEEQKCKWPLNDTARRKALMNWSHSKEGFKHEIVCYFCIINTREYLQQIMFFISMKGKTSNFYPNYILH